jgi:hypothetical protein
LPRLAARRNVNARDLDVKRSIAPTKSVAHAVAWLAVLAILFPAAARAQHACDAAGEEGWRVVASDEVAGVKDSASYRAGGDWVVDRTTTLLPLCNYFSPVGSYSLHSYALDPYDKIERVVLCHAGAAVAPYAGSCPPK